MTHFFKSVISKVLGCLITTLPIRENRISKLQIKKILKSRDSSLTRKNYQSLCYNILESFNLFPILKNPRAIKCKNETLLEELLNTPQPVIALTAHFGNWDLLAAYIVSRGGKLITIGRPARVPFFQKLLSSLKDKYGIETIWRESAADGRKLIKKIKAGYIGGVLIDQDTKVKSITSDFFGLPAKTPVSLINLGLKLNVRFVSAFMARNKDNTHTLYLTEIKSDQAKEICNQYHQALQSVICKYPEQWVWFHKRWRTPEDKTMSSEEYVNFLKNL